ncbi:hypothetical protein, partial [Streptomyces cinereoruber]|uniref:hypothetical protein n=1 Tax=Streptomyces cinereoruber TaxID=67260 RepID=UPI0036372937
TTQPARPSAHQHTDTPTRPEPDSHSRCGCSTKAATVWLPGEKGEETFGLPAFHEFAKRSAERHGCTDLRLPKAR